MFLHIVRPDPKFPQLIRDLFESVAPGQHVFVLRTWEGVPRGILHEGYEWVENADELAKVIARHSEWEGILINGVLGALRPFLEVLPEGVPLSWVVWGSEMYGLIYPCDHGILEPLTLQAVRPSVVSRCRIFLRAKLFNWLYRKTRVRGVLDRVDIVVTKSIDEFELFQKEGFLTDRHLFHEAPVLNLAQLANLESPVESGRSKLDIQVGNSASQANNHLDVFERLSKYDLTGRKVVVPLSYGNTCYREIVMSEGKRLLGNHFVPIVDFMPLPEYLERLSSCGIVILNIHRQQAIGNTVNALWEGRTVYMGRNAPFLTFKRMGLAVYQFSSDFDLDRPPVDSALLLKTRSILQDSYGEVSVKAQIQWLLDLMKSS